MTSPPASSTTAPDSDSFPKAWEDFLGTVCCMPLCSSLSLRIQLDTELSPLERAARLWIQFPDDRAMTLARLCRSPRWNINRRALSRAITAVQKGYSPGKRGRRRLFSPQEAADLVRKVKEAPKHPNNLAALDLVCPEIPHSG